MPSPTQWQWGLGELRARPAAAPAHSSSSDLQPPAESRARSQGCSMVLHSLSLTFSDFASTLQPRSDSHLPLLLGSNSSKTPLNPKVLFTTALWRLWLAVPGEGGSSVPSRLEGRDAHARVEEQFRCLRGMVAGQSTHGWRGQTAQSLSLGTMHGPLLAGDAAFNPLP